MTLTMGSATAPTEMTCAECGEPIHPERLAAQSRTVTCSRKCSDVRAAVRRAKASRAAHRKRRIKKE